MDKDSAGPDEDAQSRATQTAREEQAAAKLDQAEARRDAQDDATREENREVDTASETWHKLAGIVSAPDDSEKKSK